MQFPDAVNYGVRDACIVVGFADTLAIFVDGNDDDWHLKSTGPVLVSAGPFCSSDCGGWKPDVNMRGLRCRCKSFSIYIIM